MPPGSEDESEEDDRTPTVEGPPDEPILAPEDLDFTRDEKVEQLDEGKFVIGTEGEPRVPPEERATDPDAGLFPGEPESPETPGTEPESDEVSEEQPASEQVEARSESGFGHAGGGRPRERTTSSKRLDPDQLTGRAVKQFISSELRRTDSLYAYRIAAKTDDVVSHQQLASDDIGMAFDGLLMWYAQQVSSDTAVEDALGILLAKSNIRIRYPTKLLTAYLRKHDLSPDDDIADLLEVVRAAEGMVFPPGSQG